MVLISTHARSDWTVIETTGPHPGQEVRYGERTKAVVERRDWAWPRKGRKPSDNKDGSAFACRTQREERNRDLKFFRQLKVERCFGSNPQLMAFFSLQLIFANHLYAQ